MNEFINIQTKYNSRLSSPESRIACESRQDLFPTGCFRFVFVRGSFLRSLILFFVRQSRDSFRPKAPQVQLFPPEGSKSYAESDLVPPEGSTRSCFFRPYEKSVTIQDFFRPEAPEACLRRPVKLALQLEEYCNGSRSVNLNP